MVTFCRMFAIVDLRDSTQSVMQDYLAIRPVIHVDQGTRITVMVDRDLEIF